MIRKWLTVTFVTAMISSTSHAQVNRPNHTVPIKPGGIGTGINQGINQGVGSGINQGINQGVGSGINQGINVGVGSGINRGINVGVGSGINQGVGERVSGGMSTPRMGGQSSPAGNASNSPALNQQRFGAPGAGFSQQQMAIQPGIGGIYTPTSNAGGISTVQLRDAAGLQGGNAYLLNQYALQLGQNADQLAYSRYSVYRGYWNYGVGSSANGGAVSGSSSPLARGVGSWRRGALAYNSGYLGYFNPYYNSEYGSLGSYDYSQPIPVLNSNESADVVTVDAISSDVRLKAAVEAFKQTNYGAALNHINRAIIICPDDSVLHEMRGLVLFASGDYQKAAAAIHPVLAVGPGWNWATLCGMYPDISLYTTQLRSLEEYRTQHPQDAAPRFLLAYFYLVGGHRDAAAAQLKKVVKLQPNDQIAADLVRMLAKPPADQSTTSEQPPTPEAPETAAKPATPTAAKPIDPAVLVGMWRAERSDVSKFELKLTSDSRFHWKFTHQDQLVEFDGTYTVDGDVLTLASARGGSLVALVHPDGDRKLNFKLLDTPSDDPGLNFSK